MKAVLLAGGLGSRISEETHLKPKPMVEIGGMPILWHIMKIYSSHGINEFIVCLGYKGYVIKEYFANYFLHNADVTIDLENNQLEYHASKAEPWKITLVDTGPHTQTGGRVKRIAPYLNPDEPFCLTYGDGVGNVDVRASIEAHKKAGRKATMTVVSPPGRFGAAVIEGDGISAFAEKPQGERGRINAGYFVCEPSVIDLIDNDQTVWEKEPLTKLATSGELTAFSHEDFWQPMDTLREKNELEAMWESGNAPWKTWQ
ncbi:glucose-1-phosphate cytidylyltransferase [Kiloniella litopenaei]|uniref:Glucose-1-phosphate cytidylyltransferase n=1 Tax=Kiloniella litopenaei TaxID=1549748 RepID=A0A0M2R953_9PROT|nr:glucose-1-phosphate cytidylyltransferase [Kiloniella litopenaei]KKJ78367.1 glucose-1-phosphate cytidylyltransferase [Kiloniella litopenaei]